MEKTKKEMKNKINWAVGLSVVAVILSIFSFFISEGALQFDSINFIIGVLAILVTFLLGWQIYNVVGVKRELEKFEEKINGYKTEINTIIDEKIKESEDRIERNSLQYISSIALEFYSHFNIMSYINNMPVTTQLSLLIGGIIYGSLIKDMPQEFLESYHLLLDNFENLITQNKNDIIKLSEEEKQAILTKIKEYPHIAIFRKLEKILES
ncbi:hypothetical protein RCZ02_16400 [Capnocytophaga felis]|uniref:hypothetical protein n=1 Tax=Capnocytophaga felis TaxID=2267611 RepID=UPI0012C62AF2|nr:hypothetical protein [Capnocytophaga felis]GET48809.1 hypothetical protein RCZ02_16400 [Capnocytophaga felis]